MSKPTEKNTATDTINHQHSGTSKDDSEAHGSPSSKDTAPPSSWERIQEFADRIWAWEIFSVVVSLGAMGATVGVLAYMNNKPLTWWTAKISPNTVVSILSTLTKAMVLAVIGTCIAQLRWAHFRTAPQKVGEMDMFAKATKGTIGSLRMFWHVSKRHHSGRIACLGAFLIVIAIAIDPFSQQMLKYEVVQHAAYGLAASVPTATEIGDSSTILDNSQAWKGLYAGLLGFNYPIP